MGVSPNCVRLVGMIAIILMLPLAAMSDDMTAGKLPYRYFRSFSGVMRPYIPQNEVPEVEAKTLPGYVRAIFDPDGRVIRFEKFARGSLQFTEVYRYDERTGTLVTATLTIVGQEPEITSFSPEK